MNITLLEPFFTGSHRSWAEEFHRFSTHEVELLTLPGRHWKWRMHGGAISLAKQFNQLGYSPDLILATDMIDLALFSSLLAKEYQGIPKAIYFHENQLTYPWSPTDPDIKLKRDNHYAFINYTSALTADRVFFNSAYHKDSFIHALNGFLRQFPDYKGIENIKLIEKKSEVLPLGLDLNKFDQYNDLKTLNKPPAILWNHRWEYDKNPDTFFKTLFSLDDEGLDFQLIVLGESYGKRPAIFDEAKEKLAKKILHWGYAQTFEEYARWLWKADILPVTNVQDFFGISVIEAIYCGCTPLLPDRLAYPEHFPQNDQKGVFYQDDEELLKRLRQLLIDFPNDDFQDVIAHYDWQNMIGVYDQRLEELA